MIEPLELFGVAEFAEVLGVGRSAVSELLRASRDYEPPSRDKLLHGGTIATRFPEPVAQLACGPIWTRAQVDGYLEERKLGHRRRWSREVERYQQEREAALGGSA